MKLLHSWQLKLYIVGLPMNALRKGDAIADAFVLVARCHVGLVCAGHPLQHCGIRQSHCLFLRMSGGVIPLSLLCILRPLFPL